MKIFRRTLSLLFALLIPLQSFADSVPVYPLYYYEIDANDPTQIRANSILPEEPVDQAFLCAAQLCLYFNHYLENVNGIRMYEDYLLIRMDEKKNVQSIESLTEKKLTAVDREEIESIFNASAGQGSGQEAGGKGTGGLFGLNGSDLASAHDAGVSSAVSAGFFGVAAKAFGPSPEQIAYTHALQLELKAEIDRQVRLSVAHAQRITEIKNSMNESGRKAREVMERLKKTPLKQNHVPIDLTGVEPQLKSELHAIQRGLEKFPLERPYINLARDVRAAVSLSADSSRNADHETAVIYKEIAANLLDFGLSMMPVVGVGKDLYELIEGTNMVTGEPLGAWEKGAALLGVSTLGLSKVATKSMSFLATILKNRKLVSKTMAAVEMVARKAGRIADGGFALVREKSDRLIDLAKKKGIDDLIGMKALAKQRSDLYKKISKQIMTADRDGVKMIDHLVEESLGVEPRLGKKYGLENLPPLGEHYEDAFEGAIFKGEYLPGDIAFQAQRTGQKSLGHWFLPIKPIDGNHADELAFIRKLYGNDGNQIKAIVFKERVAGYASKIANGEGHQFFVPYEIPIDEVAKEVNF